MKKIGLMMFALVAMLTGVSAQENGPRGDRRGPRMDRETMVTRMTERQAERLGLNEEQTAKMKELNADYFAQMEQMRGGAPVKNDSIAPKKLTREERKALREANEEKMKTLRTDYMAKVKEVLTEEQYAKFEKMEKERPQGRPGGRRGGPRGGNRGDFGGDFGNPPSDDDF